MTAYRRGADFERKVAAHLRGDGYVVIRSAGSRGECDLVALKAGERPRLVQAKIGPHFSLAHRAALTRAACVAGAAAWLAIRGKNPRRHAIIWYELVLPAGGSNEESFRF